MSEESRGELDVVDESPSYLLALSEAGWGVWEQGASVETPLGLYASDDDGYQLAADQFARLKRHDPKRRNPWLEVCFWLAILTGLAWIISTAYFELSINFDSSALIRQELGNRLTWAHVISDVSYPVFLVAAVAYLLLWVRGRQSPQMSG